MSDEAKHGAVTTLSEAAQVSLPETPSTPATDAKLPEAEAKEAERSVPEPTFPPAIGGSYVSRDAQSVMLDPSDSIHVSSENLKHSEALRGTTSTSSLRTPTAATANTESCKDMPSPSQV